MGRRIPRTTCREKRTKVSEDRVETALGIGEPGGHGLGPEIQSGLGRSNETWIEVAHHGHVVDEEAVEPVHLSLQSGMRFVGQLLVRREIVLLFAGRDRRVAIALLGIARGLVDVHGDDANRADAGGLRHIDSRRC